MDFTSIIKYLIMEHPEKITYLVSSILAIFIGWIGRKHGIYLDKKIEHHEIEKQREGFNLIKELGFEVVASIYQRREEILNKILKDGKINKDDGKILMDIAIYDFKQSLVRHGFNGFVKTMDDTSLKNILESAYSVYKLFRKSSTEKK